MKKLSIIKYFFLIISGLLLSTSTFAFVVTPTSITYDQNSPENSLITFSDFGVVGHYALYKTATGAFLTEGQISTDPESFPDTLYLTNIYQLDYLNYSSQLTTITFVLFPSGFGVDEPNDTLAEALLDPQYISSVELAVSPIDHTIRAESIARRTRSYAPQVSILSPKLNSLFSSSTLIDYIVTDQNDLGDETEKAGYGLTSKPVSIYYSDKSFDLNVNLGSMVNPDFKNLIVKDLPASGKYNWLVKDLIPSNLYRIIIDAVDSKGLISEAVSDYFGFDFTPPVFKIKTNPTLVKAGNVAISIESFEDLQSVPKVLVTQKGANPIKVEMKGEKGIYEGSYTVKTGYDGTARIDVEGIDPAGNIGKEIIGGGTFSVGVNPPPKPIIISDKNKTVTYEGFTAIRGTAREDTEVLLLVNGTTATIIKPDSKGNFIFDKIKLDKTKNKGVNHLSFVSRDVFGTVSESTNIEIKYNIAPTISIIKPTSRSLLSGQIDITAKGGDENLDTLLYTFQIISQSDYSPKTPAQGENNWKIIGDDIPGGSFSYDTSGVNDGDYMIRVLVSDGYTTATSTPVSVAIKSSSSYFRFENGTKTVTKESSATIVGSAIVPSNLSSAISLKNIYYSTDGGDKWIEVKPDNVISGAEWKFSVTFNNLTEGKHPVMWRIKDSRDFISGGSHTIIVDKTAPKSPVINSPKNNKVITNDDDENLKKDGIQINISGNVELDSVVSLVFNSETLTVKTSVLGDFSFTGITLNKLGKQDLKFFTTDQAGNKSDMTTLTLVYNNPPVVTFINPKPFRGLSGKAVLSWNITDIDGDIIKNVDVSYRNSGGVFNTLLSNASAKGTYTWDTLKLPESDNYELKITATDSLTPISSFTNFYIDRTPPILSSFNIKKDITDKKVNFSGKGSASDGISGIEYVEYSIKPEDGGERSSWYRGTIVNGYLQKQASFTIKYLNDLPDNSYIIYARAVDAAGNISNELTQHIYIDKTAPRIGSFFIQKNNLNLIPDQYGNVSFYINSTLTFTVSMEQDTKTASITIGNKNIKLNKNMASGLWEATTTIDIASAQDIFITAEDSSGNMTKNKKIGIIAGVDKGNVVVDNNGVSEFVSGAEMYIYKLNDITGEYNRFVSSKDSVVTNIKTDENGRYELVLPAGNYRLSVVKTGYKVIKMDISLSRAEIISESLVTKKISGVEKIITDILNRWSY